MAFTFPAEKTNTLSRLIIRIGCLIAVVIAATAHARADEVMPPGFVESIETSQNFEMPKPASRKFRFDFKQRVETTAEDLGGAEHAYRIKGNVGLLYRVVRPLRIGVYFPFRSNVGGPISSTPSGAAPGTYHTDDMYLAAIFKPRIEPGFINEWILTGRLMVPTGEDARYLSGGKGSFYANIVANHPISRTVDLRFNDESQIYNQSTGWFMNSRKKKTANYLATTSEYLELAWSPLHNLSFSQFAGYLHTWYMALPTEQKTLHEAYLETAAIVTVAETLSLALSYRNTADTHRPQHSYAPYRGGESMWTLECRATY